MNFDDMTIGDIETFEEISGKTITSLSDLTPSQMDAKTFLALGFVFARRTNPDVTLDDVRQMGVSQITAFLSPQDADPE